MSQRGYSLIELIAVLVVIGIIAAVAVGRFSGGTSYAARGFHDELMAATRYAQLQASTTACQARIQFGAGGYDLQHENPCGSENFGGLPITHPSRGTPFQAATPSGVSLSVVSGSSTLAFDGLGVPQINQPVVVRVTGGDFDRSFCVAQRTGFVEIC